MDERIVVNRQLRAEDDAELGDRGVPSDFDDDVNDIKRRRGEA